MTASVEGYAAINVYAIDKGCVPCTAPGDGCEPLVISAGEDLSLDSVASWTCGGDGELPCHVCPVEISDSCVGDLAAVTGVFRGTVNLSLVGAANNLCWSSASTP